MQNTARERDVSGRHGTLPPPVRGDRFLDALLALLENTLQNIHRFTVDIIRDARDLRGEAGRSYRRARRQAGTLRATLRATPRFAKILNEVLRFTLAYRSIRFAGRHLPRQATRVALKDLHRDFAGRFHNLCVDLGGGLLKLGQFLSSRADLLPKVWVESLARLQDQVPPQSFRHSQRSFRLEFGVSPVWSGGSIVVTLYEVEVP